MHIAAGILGLASAAYALILAMLSALGAGMEMAGNDLSNHMLGPRLNAQMNAMLTPAGTPSIEQFEVIAGALVLVGLVMLVWGAAAFAKPSRGWCAAFLVFAIATAPAAFAAFGGPDLLLSVPACASALFALNAAKRERPFAQHQRERITPTIGKGFEQ